MVRLTCPPGSAADFLWAPDEMRWRRAFCGRPEQVAEARGFARTLFAGAECLDLVEFAVGELAANTLRHTRSSEDGGWFGVELVYDDPVYVAVTDNGGTSVPAVEEPDVWAESGRGLWSLSQLAAGLGVQGCQRTGHLVWVEIRLGGAFAG
ncbi:ATP-binding protein [Actinomadura oligospora]|uniref:ATP-binding protein n=1 Tax=Actinomadura oligospora TaxID=111804 RepID=UPI0004BBDC72|nr:ATP-binding protein [Actinomadura oligospora]